MQLPGLASHLQGTNGPVVGYMGAISQWFDLEAIRILAEKHPDWRFVLLGPVQIDIRSVQDLNNVWFLGKKEYRHLPLYAEKFDVATIPFKINRLTKAVNPVKIYEYFALGKPVVSSRLPELEQFENLCSLADNTEDFVLKVEKALANLQSSDTRISNDTITMRKNVAKENTWERRCEEIYSIICQKKKI